MRGINGTTHKDSYQNNFLTMFFGWRRHCMVSNKYHVHDTERLLNTLVFVALKLLRHIPDCS